MGHLSNVDGRIFYTGVSFVYLVTTVALYTTLPEARACIYRAKQNVTNRAHSAKIIKIISHIYSTNFEGCSESYALHLFTRKVFIQIILNSHRILLHLSCIDVVAVVVYATYAQSFFIFLFYSSEEQEHAFLLI